MRCYVCESVDRSKRAVSLRKTNILQLVRQAKDGKRVDSHNHVNIDYLYSFVNRVVPATRSEYWLDSSFAKGHKRKTHHLFTITLPSKCLN